MNPLTLEYLSRVTPVILTYVLIKSSTKFNRIPKYYRSRHHFMTKRAVKGSRQFEQFFFIIRSSGNKIKNGKMSTDSAAEAGEEEQRRQVV